MKRILSLDSNTWRLRWAIAFALFLGAATLGLFAADFGAKRKGKFNNGVYIVQMAQDPAVSYHGGVAGFKATAPAKGQKIDPFATDVVKYSDYLRSQHGSMLARVGGSQKLYDYVTTYNGFAAQITADQAATLKKQDGVLAVTEDTEREADTSVSPTFLGLNAPGGLWSQLGGLGDKKTAGAGENIIIGVIDSGIWPESKSFSDRDASGNLVFQQISGFHGKCEGASADRATASDGSWNASLCNQKLIAAQHYNAGMGGDAGVKADRPWEFLSPRDFNGHGTHTTSTAGGENGVNSGSGLTSGMAPRARVAMYKALWHTADGRATGSTSDLVAAIDQAVADGVDVINYSISGSLTNFADPVEVAFLFATDAGVFVATSAGNEGPTASTVNHPRPWLTTVAAGTHKESAIGHAALGNGSTYNGA